MLTLRARRFSRFKGKSQYNRRGTSIKAKESAITIEGVCQEEFSNAIIHAKAKKWIEPELAFKKKVERRSIFHF